ncbi:hypothetical protein CEXT_460291 [Caerostris extrusa]|uniref:Uncharacterized protein n=1 Tax=Caerostris extrusa TaxID=172846 RepID=A0AAV4Y1P8_CAEEX|nr:hypothetical protein CEXT_460291 [Caerostris extrusa]
MYLLDICTNLRVNYNFRRPTDIPETKPRPSNLNASHCISTRSLHPPGGLEESNENACLREQRLSPEGISSAPFRTSIPLSSQRCRPDQWRLSVKNDRFHPPPPVMGSEGVLIGRGAEELRWHQDELHLFGYVASSGCWSINEARCTL